jgi:hypothetical protein
MDVDRIADDVENVKRQSEGRPDDVGRRQSQQMAKEEMHVFEPGKNGQVSDYAADEHATRKRRVLRTCDRRQQRIVGQQHDDEQQKGRRIRRREEQDARGKEESLLQCGQPCQQGVYGRNASPEDQEKRIYEKHRATAANSVMSSRIPAYFRR